MKPSEVTETLSTTLNLGVLAEKLCDTGSIMDSIHNSHVPPVEGLDSDTRNDECSDVCNQLEGLSINTKSNLNYNAKLQNQRQNASEFLVERRSLRTDIEPSLVDNTALFKSADLVSDEHESGTKKDGNEQSSESEKTDSTIRRQPEEHEDVGASSKDVLVGRGPIGGLEVSNHYAQFNPPSDDYDRGLLEPSAKFRKPSSDSAQVNQAAFNHNYSVELPFDNWPSTSGQSLQLFTSHTILSGGSVAVQSDQPLLTMRSSLPASEALNVASQQYANQDIIEELFTDPVSIYTESGLPLETLDEILTTLPDADDSSTLDGGYDYESSTETIENSDVGYFSPDYSISSPGSSTGVHTLCASPDSLSNDSGGPPDDDLTLVLDYCKTDLSRFHTRISASSPPHIIESVKAQLMFDYIAPSSNASSVATIGLSNHSYGTGQSAACGNMDSTMRQRERILPVCSTRLSTPGHSGDFTPQPCFPEASSSAFIVKKSVNSAEIDNTVAAGRKYVEIRPKPPVQPTEQVRQFDGTSGLSTAPFNIPPPMASTNERPDENDDQKKLNKFCFLLAQLTTEKLLLQNEERDTVLHLAIVRDEPMLIKALLPRLEREHLVPEIINVRNMQNQTPLYMAVCMNQLATVRMLLEAGADVNIQIHRQTSAGLHFFQPIHFAASQGLEWSEVLEVLLKCPHIDVHALNYQGRTALHCAIEAHQKPMSSSASKIDSLRSIYLLVDNKADLGKEDGLSGKTPLHYVIEKKNVDFLAWFLGLIRHQCAKNTQCTRSACQIINARTSSNATALSIAWSLQIDINERVHMIKLLMLNGAELSAKHDVILRRDLLKNSQICDAVKGSTAGRTNSHS